MEGRPEPDRDRTTRHLEIVDRVIGRRLTSRRPQVSPGDRPRRAVLLREIGDRPHEDEEVMRSSRCTREHRLIDRPVVVKGLVAAALLEEEHRRAVQERLVAEHGLAQLVEQRIGQQ